MNFEEKMLKSKGLTNKIEFITIQSSERREEEVRYKNINRKQIRFDLSDISMMLDLGEILRPYGFKELVESKLAKSKVEFLRCFAEKRLAKRAQAFITALYLKYPEKFAHAELKKKGRKQMTLARGTFVISEMISQKTISLKDDYESDQSELEKFSSRFKDQEMKLRHQKEVIESLTYDGSEVDEGRLIGAR